MSARRLTDKEQRKYGKRWKIQRSRPAIRSTPPESPWSAEPKPSLPMTRASCAASCRR